MQKRRVCMWEARVCMKNEDSRNRVSVEGEQQGIEQGSKVSV